MAKRDDGSFDEFLRSSSPRLLRLAWLLTGGASSAEDLVQETLERVYVAWPRLEPGGSHKYARRTLVNLHTDGQRRRWREDLTSDLPDRARPDRTDHVVLADQLGDQDTAKMARGIRREEERMAKFLAGQIPTLTKAVAREEIPAAERNGGPRRRRAASSRSRSSSSSRSTSGSPSRSRSSGSRSTRARSGSRS